MFRMPFPVYLLGILCLSTTSFATPVILKADGHSDTYTLINQTLGGKNIPETSDCSHETFGPHIRQEFDSTLGKSSFVFYIHTANDNDRCKKFDRQRNEIKTYNPSPAYLKGFNGDTVSYRWKFKLDTAFQASSDFTHIHQIKAGDGDADMPIITLTPRAGNPDQLEIIHMDSAGTKRVLTTTPLAALKGTWIHAYEKITYSAHGSYLLVLSRLKDDAPIMRYSNADIDMWRSGTTFVRPKWGIYRSLKHAEQLRDEAVRFDEFCLAKTPDDCASSAQHH